jgi:hypothetical protein
VASRAGVPWTDDTTSSGGAVLTYGHAGCLAVDATGVCTSGSWPTIPGARWIWQSKTITPTEAVTGTPTVTFTDTFTVDTAGGTTELTLAADDTVTASANGTEVGSGGVVVGTIRFSPVVGLNTVTFRVHRSGAVGHDPTTDPAGLAYAMRTTWTSTLRVTASRSLVTMGEPTTLTARLNSAPTNRKVYLYGQPVGGRKSLVASGLPSAAGTVSVVLRPQANTVYTATYAGDAVWSAAASPPLTVKVAARWIARHDGGYRTSGLYRLYRYMPACRPPILAGCPTQVFTLKPSHVGVRAVFTFQILTRGTWVGHSSTWPLDSSSGLFTYSWYRNRGIIGTRHRVRATFPGDASHARSESPWLYWTVTR